MEKEISFIRIILGGYLVKWAEARIIRGKTYLMNTAGALTRFFKNSTITV